MSIGMGQLVHMIRRNVPVVYIIEDNGVYGLTKGQFSATADVGSALKHGSVNELPPIDPCTLAMELGCGFVARCFSGNPKQLNTILKAAFAHQGTALHRRHQPLRHLEQPRRLHQVLQDRQGQGNTPPRAGLRALLRAGRRGDRRPEKPRRWNFPDGSRLTFRTIREDYDPTDRFGAHRTIHEARLKGEFLTGLLYLESGKPTLHDFMHLVDEPVATLPSTQRQARPGGPQGLPGGIDVIDWRPGSARLIGPGAVAQLGERCNRTAEVVSSILISSTKLDLERSRSCLFLSGHFDGEGGLR